MKNDPPGYPIASPHGIPLRQLAKFLRVLLASISSSFRSSLLIAMAIHSWALSAILFVDPSLYEEAGRPLVEFITGLPSTLFGLYAISYLIKHRHHRCDAWNSLWPVLLVSLPFPLLILSSRDLLQLPESLLSTLFTLITLCRAFVYSAHIVRYSALRNLTILAICTSAVVLMDGSLLFYSYESRINPGVSHISDAFWMCFQAITGTGWNCPPMSTAGRWTAVIVWLTGFGTLASLVSSSASYLISNLKLLPSTRTPSRNIPKK